MVYEELTSDNPEAGTDGDVKVDVFMPCFNYGRYVEQAIQSLKDQAFTNFNVIIADDASSDGTTIETLRRLSEENTDPRFNFCFETHNLGINGITNKYIDKFHSKYLLIFSPDDLLDPAYLEKTVNFLEQKKAYAAVTTWVQCFGESTSLIKYTEEGASLPQMLVVNGLCGTSLIRRKVVDRVGMYATGKDVEYEDYDLWIRMLEHGYKLGVIPEPLFKYRIASTSRIHSMDSSTLVRFQLATIARHKKTFEANALYVIEALIKEKYKILDDYHHIEKLHANLLAAYKSLELGFSERGVEISRLRKDNHTLTKRLNSIPGYTVVKKFLKDIRH